MKLPSYSFQDVPGAATGSPRMPAGSPVAAALVTAGQGLEEVGKLQADAEVKKRAVQADLDAGLILADTELQLGSLHTDLKRTEQDADAFRTKYQQGAQGIIEQALKRATLPETRQRLALKLPEAQGRSLLKARETEDALFVSGRTAALEQTLENRRSLAGLTDLDRPDEFLRHLREGVEAIQGSVDVLGAKNATERAIKFQRDLYGERARRHKDTDPQGFLDEVTQGSFYTAMSPTDRDTLTKSATAAVQRQADLARQLDEHTLAQAEKELKEAEKAAKTVMQARVDDFESRALSGALTLPELETAMRSRLVQGEDYRRLRKAIEHPDERESDPATLQAVLLDSQSIAPRTTPADIDRLQASGRLNLKDAVQAKGNLRQRSEHTQSEAKADVRYRHQQAEQNLKEALTLQSPLAALYSDKFQQLRALGMEELTARSRAFGGSEDPLAVAKDIITKHLPIATSAAVARIGIERAKLPYKTKEDLTAAWGTKPLTAEFYRMAEKLKEVDEAEQEIQRLQAVSGGKVPAPAQTTTPKPGEKKSEPTKDRFGREAKPK